MPNPNAVSDSSSITPAPQQKANTILPQDINQTTLYYLRDEKLYKTFPLTSTPTIFLDKVDSYEFSPDKKRIAFIKEYGSEEVNDVYVKNLDNNSIEVTIKSDEGGTNRGVSWSPAGTYLLVDAGTGPEGSLTVYNSTTGEKLSNFGDGRLVWQDENTIYMSQRTMVEPSRPWGSGEGYSIAQINITTGASTTLVKADANNDYRILKTGDGCVYYKKDRVNDTNDWGDIEKTTSEYLCFDLVSKSSALVSDTIAKTDDLLRNQVEKVFPEFVVVNKNEILQLVSHPDHPGWIIIEVYHGDSIYDSDIAIFRLDDARNTYKVLATGARTSWY